MTPEQNPTNDSNLRHIHRLILNLSTRYRIRRSFMVETTLTVISEKDIRIKIYDTEQDLLALLRREEMPDPKVYNRKVTTIAVLRWVLNE